MSCLWQPLCSVDSLPFSFFYLVCPYLHLILLTLTIRFLLSSQSPIQISSPLRDTSVFLGVGQITTLPAVPDPTWIPNFQNRLVRPEWRHHDLEMDDKFTITIGDILGPSPNLGGADIAIVVSYRPWILPLRRKKVFRFIAKKQSNGAFYWYSYPLSGPRPPTKN